MAYVKNIWVDQDVERPKTYEVTNNQDGSITLTDSFGLVTELGTPVNEVNMNHIEDGIDGCAIRKHNLTETFNLGEWVLGGTGDDEGIYKSLIDNNVGNAITDDTKWEKVEMGGASRNIGEIVTSTIPLIDAGLHLLDGALLQYGSYQAFIDYIADIYDSGDYPTLFDTEANWQATVTLTGVCDKFVYDSVNNTVRLPKYGNQIITKSSTIASTVPIQGTGKTLGLSIYDSTSPAGIKNGGLVQAYNTGWAGANNCFGIQPSALDKNVSSTAESWSVLHAANSSTNAWTIGVVTDATKSGIVGDTSSLLTQYPLNCYYYIVIANSTKTQIQVDIDEIATDLNGKMDTDGTNAVSSVKFADGQWVVSYISLANDVSFSSDTYYEYDLSTYLPNDNYNYEVLGSIYGYTLTTSGKYVNMFLRSSLLASSLYSVGTAVTRTSSYMRFGGSFIAPIGTDRKIAFIDSGDGGTGLRFALAAYRRIGTNQ